MLKTVKINTFFFIFRKFDLNQLYILQIIHSLQNIIKSFNPMNNTVISTQKFVISLVLASFLGGLIALAGFSLFSRGEGYDSIEKRQNMRFSSNQLFDSTFKVPDGLNFIYAAELTRPAVVHIRVTYNQSSARRNNGSEDPIEDMLRQFHGMDPRLQMPNRSSGSGVIITDDGYVATNNHVIDNASEIEVILDDKRSYKARLIGKDPATDLALLKIDETGLPFIKYGDSDQTKIGEWVLAVGNPFELTSTVTAGIISAKGRNINLLRDELGKNNYAIESFIQTDAAVNPGNSGGALVNLRGELIGINTAIASQTGSYSGYSFAVPVSIVKKIMDDLMKYGEAQRALLGINIGDLDANTAKKIGLKDVKGVFIAGVNEGSAAQRAGLKQGDVIRKVEGKSVANSAELQASIATHRPGDVVTITYFRNGEESDIQVTLRNKSGETSLTTQTESKGKIEILGADFEELSQEEKQDLGIKNGVRITDLSEGKLRAAGIKEGFVITYIGEQAVNTIEDIENAFKAKRRVVAIEGVYPNGDKAYYAIGW